MADQEFRRAEEALPLTRRIINEQFSHLASARVEFVFFKKAKFTKGKEKWGYAKLVTGENSYLSLLDQKFNPPPEAASPETTSEEHYRSFVAPVQWFCIFLSKEVWDRIDEKRREALIAHELCHCWVDQNGDYSLLPHDLEEFNHIVKRYGAWQSDVQRFLDAANGKVQQDLFAEKQAEEEPGYQNVFPISAHAPRQLHAAPTNALSNGSTAMPGSEPRQLGSGDPNEDAIDAEIIDVTEESIKSETCTVRCPHCDQFGTQQNAEINAWANDEVDLLCPHCNQRFDSSHLDRKREAA